MIKNLNSPEQVSQKLLYICKPTSGSDNKPQIDFLLLEREIQQFQQLQAKSCQQIVEFVDEHRQKFINMNKKFQAIQQSVDKSEILIKKLLPKIDTYKNILYSPECKMQELITNYEKKLMQQKLCAIAKEQSQFLLDFVAEQQQFLNNDVQNLSQGQKYLIVRFLKKKEYIKSIFEHPLVQTAVRNTNQLSNLLDNISEQLQFYMSEQLSRASANNSLRSLKVGDITLLQQMKVWYQYNRKLQTYYQIIQEAIVGRELAALETFLVSRKQSLIVGKDQHALKDFFDNLFKLIQQFPSEYPRKRILKIIYAFLSKKQLNFMYSYVVPTFPISYVAYKNALSNIKNENLRKQLQTKHGWNLKFWADLRIKSIMDRSGKQGQNNLNKWIEIVFKKSFMIESVKHVMVKLAFLLVNRYCNKIQEEIQFTSNALNQAYNQLVNINEILKTKLFQGYQDELKQQQLQAKQVKKQLNVVINNINQHIQNTLKRWMIKNMEMIISTCKSSLQNYKQFTMKIVSKKDKQKIMYNTQQIILKPLHAFFANNPQISQGCQKFVERIVLNELKVYYDSEYAKQIYNHCHSHISTQQMKSVMEIVAYERQNLFQIAENVKQ